MIVDFVWLTRFSNSHMNQGGPQEGFGGPPQGVHGGESRQGGPGGPGGMGGPGHSHQGGPQGGPPGQGGF